jgi:N-methylhydantoinase A/oxoprolinase/acetone carboxylase beta subunit/N-methylhydantoinase B/oxoprolinase/acetone carboxylase alpha subunit
MRVGIDAGGTFTDLLGIDPLTSRVTVAKVPSSREAPEAAVDEVLNEAAVQAGDVDITVGTTVATNARITRSGATVIYVATAGFEDIPFIQWGARKEAFDPSWPKPDPGVMRRNCIGVAERINKNGEIVLPLTETALATLARAVRRRVETYPDQQWAIALNLLFSYVNDAHEVRVANFLSSEFPDIPISISSVICPMWREYERATTVSADAYVKPTLGRFMGRLGTGIAARGYLRPVSIMKSNGGQMSAARAADRAAEIFHSGLAGGVLGGQYHARLAGSDNALTLDMGGTSADVAVLPGCEHGSETVYELEWGIPLNVPHVDFSTIGAGGGSIAWIDSGGMLRVGPRSAGAMPGPVCYGEGGTEPTVTDANLLLGRLNPESLLGGGLPVDRAAAERCLKELGQSLGLTAVEAAAAILATVNENMAGAIRLVSVDRGHDYRKFDLVAFGGAGPVHAVELAAGQGIRRVVVPVHPGSCSAFGALLADPRVDRIRMILQRSDHPDPSTLEERRAELVASAVNDLRDEGYAGEFQVLLTLQMRYLGQSHEFAVSAPNEFFTEETYAELVERFHREHENLFGYHMRGKPAEIIRMNVTCLGSLGAVELPLVAATVESSPTSRRPVFFAEQGFVDCPIYDRESLPAGTIIEGPAVIEELSSTTVVLPDTTLEVHARGTMVISLPALKATSLSEIDVTTLSVIDSRMRNICDEMGSVCVRAAYSTLFSECRDFTTMLFDRDGQLLCQAENNPAIIVAGLRTVPFVIDEVGIENFGPGDVYVHNDPYRGACHMPEHLLLKGVFHGGELVGFVANIAHIAEIGGMAVGSFAATATEVFQEGLRLPPIKLIDAGEPVRDLWRVILANHRTPDMSWGDFHAMLASLTTGERRLLELLDEIGVDLFERATTELIDASERWMRGQIRGIPDGTYSFEDYKEDDGITNDQIWHRVSYRVEGSEVVVDYGDSDPQCRGPINLTYVATAAGACTALLQMIRTRDVPLNSGAYRPITVLAPPGQVTNVAFPGASVAGNTDGQPLVIDIGWGALAAAMPETATASHGGTDPCLILGGLNPETSEFYAHVHPEGVGWGARPDGDGNHAQVVAHASIARIASVEVTETRYPWLNRAFSLVGDSGGTGQFRGGCGTFREFDVEAPEMKFSAIMDRAEHGPWGLEGGGEGGCLELRVRRAGTSEFLTFPEAFGTRSATKFDNVILQQGDTVRCVSPGGGGYGAPHDRDVAAVCDDIADGYVSVSEAEAVFGVAAAETDGRITVDQERTRALRATLSSAS